jgi:Ni/Co efflux regulator RcnB
MIKEVPCMHSVRTFGSVLALALSASLITAHPAGAAPPEGKGKPHKEHKHEKAQKSEKAKKGDSSPGPKSSSETTAPLVSAAIGFDKARQIAVANHYTGYGALPPGIRKNLARGKPLPPGIAKKTVPGPMLAQLPSYPGHEWRIYGSDLVLVAVATAVIADVLFDVFQ